MKSIYKFTAVLAALSVAHTASADTSIHLTGSTAFRGGAATAVVALMGGDTACKIAHSGTAATAAGYQGANYTIVQGTMSGISGTTTVYSHWSGSTTGIHDLATSTSLSFISTASLPASNGYTNATINVVSYPTNATPDAAFSDVFQASSTTPTPALTDNKVAIVPFLWVANRGSSGFTNVTAQQARAVLVSGNQAKSLFTDNAADTDLVMETGRDDGSGTRATMLAETKYGVFTPLQQVKITFTGTPGTTGVVTQAQLWPVDGSSVANLAGNGGYSSGSFIKAIMGATSSSVEYFDAAGADQGNIGAVTFISCLGAGDSAAAITTNLAVKLTYEGADLYNGTAAMVPTQVYNGLYTMWGYEHLFTNGTPTGDLATFVNGVTTQFDNSAILGANGLRISQMTVSRQSDGAVVGP
jgi:hypothetical protein